MKRFFINELRLLCATTTIQFLVMAFCWLFHVQIRTTVMLITIILALKAGADQAKLVSDKETLFFLGSGINRCFS
ncbi:MAG: hypothetical protein R3B93_07310 [Bacteroidia bacterium]